MLQQVVGELVEHRGMLVETADAPHLLGALVADPHQLEAHVVGEEDEELRFVGEMLVERGSSDHGALAQHRNRDLLVRPLLEQLAERGDQRLVGLFDAKVHRSPLFLYLHRLVARQLSYIYRLSHI